MFHTLLYIIGIGFRILVNDSSAREQGQAQNPSRSFVLVLLFQVIEYIIAKGILEKILQHRKIVVSCTNKNKFWNRPVSVMTSGYLSKKNHDSKHVTRN